MIICPNPNCKTANPEGADTCQVCQSALPHHYLWGVGELIGNMRPGTMVNQRYLLKRDRTFLDTKPGLVPESLPELPPFIQPYLHLSAYPLHVPRPYSVLRTPEKDYVVMLEQSALSMATYPDVPSVLPKLTGRWPDAPPLRQLSWLWQIAQVWDAFVVEQVAATLIDSELVRVDGSVVRLLALASPPPSPDDTLAGNRAQLAQPTLVDLARSWQPLVATANQAIKSFLSRLCDSLERQQLNAEQLGEQLSQAITVCGQGQGVAYDMAVFTDQGPTRKRNEDACFPNSGTTKTLTSDVVRDQPQLLIVCDGIGGHQGGDVASKLAIATIQAQLQPILDAKSSSLTATELSMKIEAAICAANDEISIQNDRAQRQARDRMGTTLVLALVRGADVFIAHLGDSRAYRVSSRCCQQVTLDDDVASRQVRLGGSLYREVLMQPGSGSLIQALGMGPSQSLRPTVQRFVLDENCVFLLCSDGLSDSDRVEQFWSTVLKPMITASDASASAVGQRLVSLANQYNGHDNVTVGLLSAQVIRASDRMVPKDAGVGSFVASETMTAPPDAKQPKGQRSTRRSGARPITQLTSGGTQPGTAMVGGGAGSAATDAATDLPAAKTTRQLSASKAASSQGGLKKAGIVFLLIALAGGLFYAMFSGSNRFLFPGGASGSEETTSEGSNETATGTPSPRTLSQPIEMSVGDYIRVRQPDGTGIRSTPADEPGDATVPGAVTDDSFGQLAIYPRPEASQETNAIPGLVPTGSIVKVLNQQTAEDGTQWVQIQLCTIPSGDTIGDVPVETDSTGDGGTAEGSVNDVFNIPEQADQPLLLSPGAEGWVQAPKVANTAEAIESLDPSQTESCES